ncbi:DUF928 domain-containing protein (plasmid) [Kovacikia minuta CCNUW1]|uniref:DUF928 domain-containing protein n=1 Tax=Kovacikia minuta TaxID=2931930 RepID=UPI001CD01536|nr:DUF928 domain-containing protein [Kovacikia minuta]UBF30378.1 DUF928 domain-containing protein [Kovacikia minuta CCNUW1]
MSHIKWLSNHIPVSMVALGLAIVNSASAITPSVAIALHGDGNPSMQGSQTIQLAQSNPPPPPRNPGRSSPGGRRDPSNCPQDAEASPGSPLLTALSPISKPGLTLAEHPTFLVYVPKTSATSAEFSLRSRDGRGIYRTTVALTKTPNLITLTLPAQTPPLTVGQTYTWSFAIICNPNDRLDDRFVTGMVQRIEVEPARLRQIQQASPRDQVALYQQANAWYDTLAVLYRLHRSQTSDPGINTIWRELLQSGGSRSHD